MSKIGDLKEPSIDAIAYNARERKAFFEQSYHETAFLETASQTSCYYFIGEKGSGKTALALHIQNSAHNNIQGKLISVSETQYKRFMLLKENEKLEYTDYSLIWRATLLYLFAKFLVERRKWHHKLTGKFSKIEAAIEHYDKNSQIPELEYVMEFVTTITDESEASGAIPEIVSAGVKRSRSQEFRTSKTEIRSSLLECEKIIKSGLQSIKLDHDVAIFLDGLDAKPSDIQFKEYQNCLGGLSEAAWQLNTEFFSQIRDSKGKMRAVLLLRPDVFNSLNIHNSNCKLSDNSVFFDWHTTNDRYADSDLYKMANKYFTSQDKTSSGWPEYFSEQNERKAGSFLDLMRLSFQRPRDIFSAIRILIRNYKQAGKHSHTAFLPADVNAPWFREEFSDYLLGEVKNYANYYVDNDDFEAYASFFDYLDGAREFDFDKFSKAYSMFIKTEQATRIKDRVFMQSPETFLQFWYDVNAIGYKQNLEDGSDAFYHWAYRERSTSKVMPKIMFGGMYMVHDGLSKSLNIGKRFSRSKK